MLVGVLVAAGELVAVAVGEGVLVAVLVGVRVAVSLAVGVGVADDGPKAKRLPSELPIYTAPLAMLGPP